MGWVLAALGVALSAWALWHDRQRHRIAAEVPQAAPSRVPPEIHFLAALVTAGGVWLLAGWPCALGALVGQALLGVWILRQEA